MNLVGKIFVVLIFVMSLVFATLTVVVYATHTNWKLVCDNAAATAQHKLGLSQQLQQKLQINQELDGKYNETLKQLGLAKKLRDDALAKLVSETSTLEKQVDTLKSDEADLRQEASLASAALKAAHETFKAQRDEILGLVASINTANTDRDVAIKKLLDAQNDLYQTGIEILRLRQLMDDLQKDLKKAEDVLRHYGHNKDQSLGPPNIDTVITEVPSADLVAIKAGADDGLREGDRLIVYHVGGDRTVLVGWIKVLETQPDRAVCSVDPNRQRNVQVGDRARIELKLQ